MARAGQLAVPHDSAERRLHDRSAPAAPARTALILYGSETGNAQDVAEEVGRLTDRLRCDTTVLDLDSVQLRELVKPTLVIFVISTAGQGEVPQNARAFWKLLLSSALKPGVLRKLRFSSFGLGDSSYPQFNVAHRALHGRLVQLGARPFCERGEGNEQHPEGHSAGFREWGLLLKQKLAEVFPLPDGLEAIPDDTFIEPKWKLEEAAPGDVGSSTNVQLEKPSSSPSQALMPVTGSYPAYIESNERITAADHFQDVRLLDLRVQESIEYGPGAVAVVYPKNFPEDVQQFIDLMNWKDMADQPLQLIANQRQASDSPSPLRNLNLTNTTLTLRWLLSTTLDIMSIPRRSFFATLAHFAHTQTPDEQYQKTRLLELANPELIDELWDYTTRPKRTILEVMMDFTTLRIPWQYALTTLPLIRGRQASIASGGALKRDEQGRTRIQLLVAIVDPPSPIIRWRRRYGVCTRYIASLQSNTRISLGVQKGYLDVRRSELAVPVIMIGPGTGLAPMRAMIHERLLWSRDGDESGRRSEVEDLLFFGCRSPKADFFFRDEFEELRDAGRLRLHVAFSRDKQVPRQYVQDSIRENGKAVAEALRDHGGKVYVCGSSGNMPKGVREALANVLVRYGINDGGEIQGGNGHEAGEGEGGSGGGKMDAEEAAAEAVEAFLGTLEKSGRYKQETW